MASRVPLEAAKAALRERLVSIAPHILAGEVSADRSTVSLLQSLSTAVRESADPAKLWLLMTGVAGVMPMPDEFRRLRRLVEICEDGQEWLAVLEGTSGPASTSEFIGRPFTVKTGEVLIEVDFSARHGHNTGIQRVVRETVKRWVAVNEPMLVAWSEDGGILRSLTIDEFERVIKWSSEKKLDHPVPHDDVTDAIVPWRATILFPEVAAERSWERAACAAEFSGNTVVMVGYDAIPVTSAEYIVPGETDRFVRYLSVVKHASAVIGISESSAQEFQGFVDALGGQGLQGPVVSSVTLPVDAPTWEDDFSLVPRGPSEPPLVVCVGTQEPRKNQMAVLAACEALWAAGVDFEMLFIGGAAVPLSIPFDKEVDRLKKLGRRVTVLRHISDAILHRAYVDSRFTIFVSMHEGYGLPVGESLALGVPVITTKYGSMAEIAAGGGCLSVDPRNDDDIIAAMASLLTDDAKLDELRREAAGRVPRTWDDYAAELWLAATSAKAPGRATEKAAK